MSFRRALEFDPPKHDAAFQSAGLRSCPPKYQSRIAHRCSTWLAAMLLGQEGQPTPDLSLLFHFGFMFMGCGHLIWSTMGIRTKSSHGTANP